MDQGKSYPPRTSFPSFSVTMADVGYRDAALSRRLVHTVMMVDLVSPDGRESRGVVRVREGIDGGTYYRRNFLGGTFRLSSTFRSLPLLSNDNGKGKEKGKGKGEGEGKNVFIFSEMVVRTPGEYALVVRLLDIAGWVFVSS